MNPTYTLEEARRLALDLYGIDGQPAALPSYSDQNFRITSADGSRFVLKVASLDETKESLEFQQAIMQYLADYELGFAIPHVIPAKDGATLIQEPERGHWVWAVSFLEGRTLEHGIIPNPQMLTTLGTGLGRLDEALSHFSHPGMHRTLAWDLQQAPSLRTDLDAIPEGEKRDMIACILDRYDVVIHQYSKDLRQSVVHNDANPYNLLVNESGTALAGLIDFGDSAFTYLVAELAIASAYVLMDSPEELQAIRPLVTAYQAAFRLSDAEQQVFLDLIKTRLATSVVMAALRQRHEPENEYLSVSVRPAWEALHKLHPIHASDASSFLFKS